MTERDPAVTSRIMAAVRARDTRPEMALRRALFARGFRYRASPRRVPGTPDIVFLRAKVAVFVDGDFWHGNAWRSRGAASTDDMLARWRNPDFWRAKIRANVERDRRVDAELLLSGWRVVRLWESEIAADLAACVGRVQAIVYASEAWRGD